MSVEASLQEPIPEVARSAGWSSILDELKRELVTRDEEHIPQKSLLGGSMNIGALELVIILFVLVILVWPMWRIVGKAGFPPGLALIGLIPFGFLVLYFALAFVSRPSQRRTVS